MAPSKIPYINKTYTSGFYQYLRAAGPFFLRKVTVIHDTQYTKWRSTGRDRERKDSADRATWRRWRLILTYKLRDYFYIFYRDQRTRQTPGIAPSVKREAVDLMDVRLSPLTDIFPFFSHFLLHILLHIDMYFSTSHTHKKKFWLVGGFSLTTIMRSATCRIKSLLCTR